MKVEKKTGLILALAIGLISNLIHAQGFVIKGSVTEANGKTPIQGAHIQIEGSSKITASNVLGAFEMNYNKAGNVRLICSAIGYLPTKESRKMELGDTLTLHLTMNSSSARLKEAMILADRLAHENQVPGSGIYLSQTELAKLAPTDPNRALRNIPGISVQEEDGFGLRPNIGLRGSGVERSSRITIMEDGILMAPAPYSAPAAYFFPNTMRMQGIEVLKGSGQLLYGPFTTGGAINFISAPIPDEFSGSILISAGAFGHRQGQAWVGNRHKNLAYVFESANLANNGFKILDGSGNTGFNRNDLMAKVRINTNEKKGRQHALTAKIAGVNEVANETYLGLTREDAETTPLRRYAGSQMDQINSTQRQGTLTYSYTHKKGEISVTGYRTELWRNWYKVDKYRDSLGTNLSLNAALSDPLANALAVAVLKGEQDSHDKALEVKANNRNYVSQGIQLRSILNWGSNLKQSLNTGLRLHYDEHDRFQWSDWYAMRKGKMYKTESGIPGTDANRVDWALALSGYAQYGLTWKKLNFRPGLRIEYVEMETLDYGKLDTGRLGISLNIQANTQFALIPGASVGYQISDHWSAFAGVHKGFSPPGSNPNTRPEASINYEIGGRFDRQFMHGFLTGFFTDFSNLLGSDFNAGGGGGTGDLYNGGAAECYGIEAGFSTDLLLGKSKRWGLPFSVNYTWMQARFLSSFVSGNSDWGTVAQGDLFPYLPEHQINLNFGLEHARFRIFIQGRYANAARIRPGQGNIASAGLIDPALIFDAGAHLLLTREITLQIRAQNMGQSTYLVAARPAGWRPGMPFNFQVGLKATF
ncbi:MAG: TonB-dependent receptor [Bacteroidetes bacterium]|nr:TonB-dependent receptor [Bacteroidota bacterium]